MFVVLLGLFAVCDNRALAQDKNTVITTLQTGSKLPSFSFRSHTGRQWDQNDLNGKVTLVNFWYIGSKASMNGLNYLNLLTDSIQNNDFQIVSIARNNADEVRGYLDEKEMRYDLLRQLYGSFTPRFEILPVCAYTIQRREDDCSYLTDSLMVVAYPTTLLVGKDGKIRIVKRGFPAMAQPYNSSAPFREQNIGLYFDMLKAEIEKLLAE